MLSDLAYSNYLALSQSRKLEKAARSQSAYIMDMSLNMEKNVDDWMSIAKEAVNNGDKSVMESLIKELINKSSDVYTMIGDTIDYIRMAGGEVELNETVYESRILFDQTAEKVKEKNTEKSFSINVEADDSVPQYLLGDSGKIGQILNKLFLGCIAYSEKTVITVKITCRKTSYSSILYIDIIANSSEIPEELIKSINSHFTSVSTDNVISESGESFFSPSLIGVLIKQMSGSIEVGHGVAGEPVFRLIIPQLEIRE